MVVTLAAIATIAHCLDPLGASGALHVRYIKSKVGPLREIKSWAMGSLGATAGLQWAVQWYRVSISSVIYT